MNDRKHDDLSMWEHLAYIGNRYCGLNGRQKRHTKTSICISPTAVCIEEWMCAWKACMEGSSHALNDRKS